MPKVQPPPECANCGAEIPPGARACPECGADERTGWRDTSVYDGIDLPDESAEPRGSRRVNGLAWYWWLAALGVLGLALLAFL